MKREFEIYENAVLNEKFYSLKHESGLTVQVFPKKMSSLYAVYAVKFGSVNNRFSVGGKDFRIPDGVAHFLEHKMFEGKNGKNAFELYAEYGASANAYTSALNTAYLFSSAEDHEKCLGVLLDFVNDPYFTEENIKKEQGIISQEIGMYDDNPFSRLYYATLKLLYKNHPVRNNICGSVSSISEITPELLYNCYNAFYRPENMVLCVCGDISPERVLAIVDGKVTAKAGDAAVLTSPDEPDEINEKYAELKMDISKPMVSIAFKDNDIPTGAKNVLKRSLCMEILCELLFGKSSAFYDKMYAEGLISSSFSAEYIEYTDCGSVMIFDESGDDKALKEAVLSEVKNAIGKPFSKDDFERVRRSRYSESVRSFDSTDDIANDMMRSYFSGYNVFLEPDMLSAIKYSDVLECLSVFKEENCVTAKIIPTMQRG